MIFAVQAMPRAEFDKWLADAKAGATPRPSVQPGGEVLELAAANFAFDKTELRAAADTPFTLRFTNADSALHNVAIQDANGEEVFRTADLSGPNASEDYAVAAAAGR